MPQSNQPCVAKATVDVASSTCNPCGSRLDVPAGRSSPLNGDEGTFRLGHGLESRLMDAEFPLLPVGEKQLSFRLISMVCFGRGLCWRR